MAAATSSPAAQREPHTHSEPGGTVGAGTAPPPLSPLPAAAATRGTSEKPSGAVPLRARMTVSSARAIATTASYVNNTYSLSSCDRSMSVPAPG